MTPFPPPHFSPSQVVSPQTCHEIFVLSLLTSSCPAHIELAGTLMSTDAAEVPAVTNVYLRKLPFDVATKMVVTAAAEYFDASASLADPGMKLARQCLQVSMARETGGGGGDREGPSPPRAPLISFPGGDPGRPNLCNENGPFLLLLNCF